MRQGFFKKLTAAACALTLSLTLQPGVLAAGTSVSTKNINKQDYTTYGSTVTSYLYENGQGGVTRVEYTGGTVVVEDYDGSYNLTGSRSVQAELPIWGGFFAGKDANFLIFGQKNPGQSDSAEVIRVVKYSKDWQRQGQASLKGANTTVPFDAGSLRCDEYGGYLYIRTCHEMYKSKDGYNHQSNLTMAVRQSDMTVTDSYYDVMNSSYGYISHSFNQFLIVDEDGKIVTLDHGDAYPRGVVFCKYYADAGSGKFTGQRYGNWCSCGEMLKFAGSVGNNTTGGSIGGLAETTDCYVMAYNYDGKGGTGPRDAYYHYMDKASGKSWSVKLTSGAPGVTTPVLAPAGLSGGYVMWNGKSGSTPNDTLYYMAYGANGAPGETKTAKAPLSDCQPVYHGGKAVWYVTNNSAPTFYGLDASGVTVLGSGGVGTAAKPAVPETPVTPAKPETPAQPGGTLSIMTDPMSTFTDTFAIMPDNSLTRWWSWIEIQGKTGKEDHSVVKVGENYRAGSNMFLLKTDGSLYLFDNPGVYEGMMKISDNVKQFSYDVYLKNDGTVWSQTPLDKPGDTYSATTTYDNFAKIADNAKQVYGDYSSDSYYYLLKNDGSLWSWGSHYLSSEPNSYLGRDGGRNAGVLGKVMDKVAYVTGGMAIKTDGTLWCWGKYPGNGTEESYTPVKVMDNVVGAWSEGSQRFALTKDGALYSWGLNSNGRALLGYVGGNQSRTYKYDFGMTETVTWQDVPRKVDIDNVCAVYCGSATVVQKRDGSLWAIGNVTDIASARTNPSEDYELTTTFRKFMDGTKLCGVTG